jgi:hypothetical protein
LKYIFKYSRLMGLIPTLCCALLWLWGGARVAVLAGDALAGSIPDLAVDVSGVIVSIVGLGALVSLWLISDHMRFFRRGFRMRWVEANHWLYEERAPVSEARLLPCERVTTGDGYPAPCEVCITSESAWNLHVPPWAWNRRQEILRRIALCFGAEHGGSVRFVDATHLRARH